MRKVFVLGIGMLKIGRYPNKTNFDLGRAGILAAIKDAGIDIRDIQAGFFSNRDDNTPALGEQILGLVGRNGNGTETGNRCCHCDQGRSG